MPTCDVCECTVDEVNACVSCGFNFCNKCGSSSSGLCKFCLEEWNH